MKIEVFGQCNPDGSSHPAWRYEIDSECDRVMVTLPGFTRDQAAPKVWGFVAGKQVHGTLISHDQKEFWHA